MGSDGSQVEAVEVNEDAILGYDRLERAMQLLLEEEHMRVDPELVNLVIPRIRVRGNIFWTDSVESVWVHSEFHFEGHQ